MDMRINLEAWPQLNPGQGGERVAASPVDWAGLRARLIAARNYHAEIMEKAGGLSERSGSFDPSAATELSRGFARLEEAGEPVEEKDLRGVNPVGLTDGKGFSAMELSVAATEISGDRG